MVLGVGLSVKDIPSHRCWVYFYLWKASGVSSFLVTCSWKNRSLEVCLTQPFHYHFDLGLYWNLVMATCFASPLIILSCCWSQPVLCVPFLGYFLWWRVISKAELRDGAAWPWFSIQEWGFHVPWQRSFAVEPEPNSFVDECWCLVAGNIAVFCTK